MKRIYHVIILLCFAVPIVSAQNRNTVETNRSGSDTNSQTTSIMQERLVPARIISALELEKMRVEAVKEIELTSQLLQETNASVRTSLNRLNLFAQQLIYRRKIISILGQEIAEIDRNIEKVTGEIEILEKDLAKTKENYAKSLQNQQQEYRSSQYKMLIILSADNLTQSYRRMRYMREYADWQRVEADRIIAKQSEIMLHKAELEKSRIEKQELLAQRENENRKLEEEEKLQQREVRELNQKQRELQRLIEQKRREAAALDRQIELLIAEDIKRSEENRPVETASETISEETVSDPVESPPATTPSASTAAIPSASPPAATPPTSPVTTANNYILTESETVLSKRFADSRGNLPYPLTGNYTIVSPFGESQHQELSYVRTNNNGIDIQTTAGSEARAIFNGVVTRIFVMPGFNNNVIIRHGDYLTVYSNLSDVYVKAGDAVAPQQTIGKIFTDTEKGNETILHFQLWKERTKLNPAAWIK